MQRFEPGQEVVCVHPTGMWLGVIPGPFPNDIVTVSGYSVIHPDNIELVEYPISRVGNILPDCYKQMWFEPLANISELELKLKETIAISLSTL